MILSGSTGLRARGERGRSGLAAAGLLAILVFLSCGQEDPTFRPDGGGTVPKGSIAVSSSVPGALISLDGVGTGRVTPDTLREVDEGEHRIGVFLAGFFPPDDQVITVIADSLEAVHFELTQIPVSGGIAVTAPYPASILVDGAPTGLAAPDTVSGLAPGEHAVTLVLAGFRSTPEEHRITVVAGEVAAAEFDLVVPKVVVCEDFSNYACIPCPAADAALQEVLLDYANGRAFSVNPHVNFPGQGDPFFQFNPAAANARIFLNQVSTAPTITVDGVAVPMGPPWVEPIRTAIEARLQVEPTLAIGVRSALGASELRATVDVWVVATSTSLPPSNLLLYTWIVEREVILEPPGPNGQSEYRNVMRHLFPTPASGTIGGEPLGTLTEGERRTFEYVWPLAGNVDPSQLAVAAFAQENGGQRRVIQSGSTLVP